MLRDKIINDINFREKCCNYELNWDDFIIRQFSNDDYIILLHSQNHSVYVLLDKNYNTIGVERCDSIKNDETALEFAAIKYCEYCNFTDDVPFGENFGYPFETFTLKQVIDLSNRVEIMETNHGNSLMTRVNGDWYERNADEDYFQLLSYIKFLGEEIKQYFLYSYQMQMMGFEVPNVYLFTRTLISKVNECVDYYIKDNIRPYPCDILSYIGQNSRKLNFNGILYDVVDLLMRDKGVKIKSGSPNQLESIQTEEKKDLSKMAMQLLKILDLSDEDLKKKEKEDREKSIEKKVTAFNAWLKDDNLDDDISTAFQEENGSALKKTLNQEKK